SLTILNLFRCSGLTALPNKLPDSLTKLVLFGCTSLTEEVHRQALFSLLRSNLEKGLRFIDSDSFEITDQNTLYRGIAEGLIGESLPPNQHPRDALVDALEKKLSSESGDSAQVALAKFISNHQNRLLLHDEHPLMQNAVEILSSNSIPGE